MSYQIEPDLYWQMPGPRQFIKTIAVALRDKRGIFINIPDHFNAISQGALIAGLKHTNSYDNPISLIVRGGTDITLDLGVHFQSDRISGGQLACLEANMSTVVILTSVDTESQKKCEEYASEFIKSTSHSNGNIQLLIKIQDESFLTKQSNKHLQIIPFDGGLKNYEMDAYVSLKMIDRDGPENTRLYKAVISEFSGFDCSLAERLITMDDNQIIFIREYLVSIMEENLERWRYKSWLNGTFSIVSEDDHVLRDIYLQVHGTPKEQKEAKYRIDKRYWRACLREITPWLEANRHKVFEPLMPIILLHTKDNSLVVPAGNRNISVSIDNLEYGNVSGLIGANRIRLRDKKQIDALKACRSAKIIRDEISHLRSPTAKMVSSVFLDIKNTLNQ